MNDETQRSIKLLVVFTLVLLAFATLFIFIACSGSSGNSSDTDISINNEMDVVYETDFVRIFYVYDDERCVGLWLVFDKQDSCWSGITAVTGNTICK